MKGRAKALELRSTGFQKLNRVPNQIPAALQLKLFLEVGAMGLDGLDAAVEFFGDLAGTEAKPDQVQDIELTFAQACDRRAADASRRDQPLR